MAERIFQLSNSNFNHVATIAQNSYNFFFETKICDVTAAKFRVDGRGILRDAGISIERLQDPEGGRKFFQGGARPIPAGESAG